MGQLGSHWTDFHVILYLSIFRKFVEKIHVTLKSHKNNEYITWCVQVLRSPKEAFAAAMQSWRERCEKCVCLQGDYVEK